MYFKRIIIASCLLIFCFVAAASNAEIVDRVVAVVDGDVITLSELDNIVNMKTKSSPKGSQRREIARREVLDQMIDEVLLNQAIEKAKITVNDDDLARAIANVLRQNKITIEQLHADLARKGISFENYKKQLMVQIRYIKFINQVIGTQIKISERELRDYYERNINEYGGGSSTLEAMREAVYEDLYNKRSEEALKNYLLQQRQKSYIDIRL